MHALLLKTDYATAQQTVLCNVPGCTHDNAACPAWLEDWARTDVLVMPSGIYLYYTGLDDVSSWEQVEKESRDFFEQHYATNFTDEEEYIASCRHNYELSSRPSSIEKLNDDLTARETVLTFDPSLLGGEQKKSIRMDTLGDGYTPADLRAVIAGEKAHTPQKNAAAPVKPEKRSGNLLVDIQTKLRAGKGAGYARWATLFNLKQMAQTVAYLQDHELLDYAVLSEKAAEASAHFNELSARIKAAETRMAEIAVLREHIVNYAKTRDTYVAYRKAGYSKKFLAEHESEITIHKAAKNYFDGLGFKKLPTIKALNTEYAELLAEKKAAYADYRKAREEMKELLTAKANIDRILELDKEQEEANERREKEAEQR